MNDQVRIIIDGKELSGWTGCSISMAVDQGADAFSVDGPWDPERQELRAAFRPFGYQRVQLYLDEDLYLTGFIDKIAPAISASDRKVNVQGRSLTGQLDCSIFGDLEFYNLTLAQIARKLCKPFGVSVRADNDSAAIPEARAEYGQGVFDFLNSLAAPRNILLNCSYKGELVLTWGNALVGRDPVARLIEGEWPIESVSAEYDSTKRFSLYRVATQFAGVADVIDTAYDNGVGVYRPRLMAAVDAVASPTDETSSETLDAQEAAARDKAVKSRTAARLRAEALAASGPVSATVSGWRRPDDKRWAERQVVTLLAPSAMIYREMPWVIAGVQLTEDVSGGRKTSLRLVLPETYSGTMPREVPWAS